MTNPPSPPKPSNVLILPPRQLNAALRKSAARAQKLADAFGKTVPCEPAPRQGKLGTGKSTNSAPVVR